VPIGDRAALAASASQAGMDEDAVRTMLDGDAYTSAVRDDEQEAAMLGITAVPFFVIDRRYGLPGAHPPETIRAAIDRAREERARTETS
jgi:predicted DsbA family dithiol-disulfide isomerase